MANKTNILSKALWFSTRQQFDIDFFELLEPQRKVNKHSRSHTGIFYSEKCNRNIQYESGLERDFFQQLEQNPEVLHYWEQPVRIVYWRGKRKDSYTPDIAIYTKSREIIIVEIKDLPGMLENRVQTKTEAFIKFCCKKGFGLLVTDGKHTIHTILKTRTNRKLQNAILKAVDNHILRKKECRDIVKQCQATQNQLLKIIIKHNLKFRNFPFRLEQGNKNILFHQVFYQKKNYEELRDQRLNHLFKP